MFTETVPTLEEITPEEKQEIREMRQKFLVLAERLKKIIFGRQQELGIVVAVNSFLVHVQREAWNRGVSTISFLGSPGSGKTTLAEAIGQQINGKFHLVNGLADMTPNQLMGHIEWLPHSEDGEAEWVHHPGFVPPGTDVFTFDEYNRSGGDLQSAFGHITTAGRMIVGGQTIDLAPPGHHLIVVLTANPPTSVGTRETGAFFADRTIATTIFRTPWDDDWYVEKLLSSKEHWEKVEEEGLLSAVLNPEDIVEAQKMFDKYTKGSVRANVYMISFLRKVVRLSQPYWYRELSDSDKKELPPVWQDMKKIPTAPLFEEIAGRTPQHFAELSRADSFLTYGKLETQIESVQRMAKSIFAHRIMCRLLEGGLDILYDAYGNDILTFTEDVLDWLLRSVPTPLDHSGERS